MINDIPRGIEVLVKKATVDPAFKALLLAERSAAAAEIGLELSETETAILDGVPAAQLEAIIANTTVGPKLRPAFMGRAAAVMLAALGTTIVTFAEQVESGEAGVTTLDNNTTIETGDEHKKGVISGRVTDENGDPISGALVVVKGANMFATTNVDGYYEIDCVPEGSFDVKASRVGYSEMSITGAIVIAGQAIKVSFILKSKITGTHVITGTRP